MDLKEISCLIVNHVKDNLESERYDELTIEEVASIIKNKVVDALEPEKVYEIGKFYDGFGVYIGIIDTYPFNENYFKRQHHFREKDSEKFGGTSKINKILIREIKK